MPCRLLGREAVHSKLLTILDKMPTPLSLREIASSVEQLFHYNHADALMYDYLSCLSLMTKKVAETTDVDAMTGQRDLRAHLDLVFASASEGNPRTTVIDLATGHAAKGLEWRTTLILEPASMMLKKVVDQGGLAAEDEGHVKHVLVSRAKHRLIFMRDVFFNTKSSGVSELFAPSKDNFHGFRHGQRRGPESDTGSDSD